MEGYLTEEDYRKLIVPYEESMETVEKRILILGNNYQETFGYEAIHHIQMRVKTKTSIEGKLLRKGSEVSLESARDTLQDIAGIRVICYDAKVIYEIAECLKKQNDMEIIREKDYIVNPKRNGYRSYHLIVGVPFYLLETKEYYPVEIQFRTMAMDMWASLEHRNCYKKSEEEKRRWQEQFREYAALLDQMERDITQVRDEDMRKSAVKLHI
ncbi:(p)ppGpp synthetase [Clostridium sp. AM58-1XD]|uniref:GTP pyrophosphokinase n=1 Tax=Clostridium sp. AM58-1XD TaxID=2292307 RepID=UPI001FA8E399|nr:(p)ppGpp synthetase [Clostridium sp. AM58-1XD]